MELTDGSFGEVVEAKYRRLAEELSQSNEITESKIQSNERGIWLTLVRSGDAAVAELMTTPTTESFDLRLDRKYENWVTAYDDEAKIEAIEDHIAMARLFIQRKYKETKCERGGQVLSTTILLADEGHSFELSKAYGGLVGVIRRKLGCQTSITYP